MVIISDSYDLEDFKEFINEIKEKNSREIIQRAKKELHQVRTRDQGDTEYAEVLRGFLFFLQWGKKPSALNEKQFQVFKPVLVNLIEKKDAFNRAYLRYFEN